MSEPLAKITPRTGLGMLMIRADLDRAGDALAEAAGLPVPDTLRATRDGAGRLLGWMSPDELLLVLPVAEVAETQAALEQALRGEHALVADVSDMRVVHDITGPHAEDVIAKLAPLDLAALPEDGFRRTRAAQVAAAVWRIEGGFRLIAMRSVADYVATILTNAAAAGTTLAPR